MLDHGIGAIVPPPGYGVYIHATAPRSAASQELLVTTAPDGTVSLERYGDEGESSLPPSGGPINPLDNACEDDAYTLNSYKWYSTMSWKLNYSGIPANLTLLEAEIAVRAGTTNITTANNDCGFTDNITATEAYGGTTGSGIQVNADGTCGTHDGLSVVRFLPMTVNYLAVACTWFETAPNPDKAIGSDIRINTNFDWETDTLACIAGGLSAYMVEDVMTHERGHSYGMGHVSESAHEWLTMSENSQGPCDMSMSTLGLGDYNGLNARY